jgi:hypothetical protein
VGQEGDDALVVAAARQVVEPATVTALDVQPAGGGLALDGGVAATERQHEPLDGRAGAERGEHGVRAVHHERATLG